MITPANQEKELAQSIKAQALRLGFVLAGITTPDPPPHLDVFLDWLAAGRHGEMSYLASERSLLRRGDPRQIMAECRSILVLAAPYDRPLQAGESMDKRDNAAPPFGRVAAYAWGKDYHNVLGERMQALIHYIEMQAARPVASRWYTDTGPLLERELAQRAGLGWIGKNTCLINPQLGSTFLLAEILLDLVLPPDLPFSADRCGTCTRCLQACPTACILPDRTLDARRCISYLTIESREALPPDLRPLLGEWVFGCDICQQVCPWNQRYAPEQGDPAFAFQPDVALPELAQELRLSQEEFSARFKGSPIKRSRRSGYLRNTAVAAGNVLAASTGDHPLVEALRQTLLDDPDPLVRGHAAWAAGRSGSADLHQALEQAAHQEAHPYVRGEIRAARSPKVV
jgi:epoxyqueuosine reductase